MARTISLGSLTFIELLPPVIARLATAVGFETVGLRAIGGARPGDIDFSLIHDSGLRAATRRALSEGGLRVLDVEGFRITANWSSKEGLENMRRLIDVAVDFDASRLLVFSEIHDQTSNEDAFAQLTAFAAGSGVVPGLEFAAWSGVSSLAQAREVVGHSANEGGIVVDALHLSRTGGTPEDVALVDDVAYLQLSDAPMDAPLALSGRRAESRDRRLPGEGDLPLTALLSAIPPHVPISVALDDAIG
jgi:sugar phosphate isomerase/epimerase